MNNEIGISIDRIDFGGKNFLYPFFNRKYGFCDPHVDLNIYGKDGTIYICGKDNDWGYLLVEPMKELFAECEKIKSYISELVASDAREPKAIALGKSEYRILDICNKIISDEERIKICNLDVFFDEDTDGVALLY